MLERSNQYVGYANQTKQEVAAFLLKNRFKDVQVTENCKAIDGQRLIVDKAYHAPVPCEIIPVLDLSIVVNFKNFVVSWK